jgi:predicted PurR-regulated permease PerM
MIRPAVEKNTAALIIRDGRNFHVTLSLGILAFIAMVASLYLARSFFVPLLIGILASYALHPLVDCLKKCYLPRPIGAALVLAILVGGVSWATFSLSDDTAAVIEKMPDAARKLRENLSEKRTGSTALQNMQETANQLEGAAADAGAKPGTRTIAIHAREPTAWLHNYALAQSTLVLSIIAQTPVVLLLTYFLLASGTQFRRKLVQFVGPTAARKNDAIAILDEIDVQIQRYLLTILISNVLAGIGTWLAFEALGMEQAGVWGVVAGVLHFIPYLGPALVALGAGMAAFLQFGSVIHALAAVGLAILVSGIVGLGFSTWLQSRFASVNSAILFISLLFFSWIWGVWGLLLGGPLVAITKVICDRVKSLKPLSELLER